MKLTDLEICKKIAEIEGHLSIDNDSLFAQSHRVKIIVHGEGRTLLYNPLTDDALCFQLMVKYKMQLTNISKNGCEYICYKQNVYVNVNNTTKGIKSPNKAICLAIIKANITI